MATLQRRMLVNKQFNSPIGLYSNANVQETLDRELKRLGNGAIGQLPHPPQTPQPKCKLPMGEKPRQLTYFQMLQYKYDTNGAIGIDFDDPSTTKPSSLAKSAVLQALEDEEREKSGFKRVAWPPPAEINEDEHQQQLEIHSQILHQGPTPKAHAPKSPTYHQQPQYQHHQQQPQHHYQQQTLKSPIQQQHQPRYSPIPQQQTLHSPQIQVRSKSPGLSCTTSFIGGKAVSPRIQSTNYNNLHNSNTPLTFTPLSPSINSSHTPTHYSGGSPSGWAHVASPQPTYHQQPPNYHLPTTTYYHQIQSHPSYEVDFQRPNYYQSQPQAHLYQTPQYQPQATEAFQPTTHYQQPEPQQQQQQYPGYITPLRQHPPITQKPAPVYSSQPVAAIYQGGSNMRGDEKWPPAEYKSQADVDNQQRKQIALGPAFRPRRQNKDYVGLFCPEMF
uniref:Putative basic-leucine zipper bzip transcription factor n=1 Tax=Corethrella appendiculata TaxID=1370023 RepID=U5EML1_9DIPT